MEYVITFKNTNFAIKSEQCLLERKLRVTVMPLPSQISAGCGICLRLRPDEIREALGILEQNGVDQAGLFLREPAGSGGYAYTEIKGGKK